MKAPATLFVLASMLALTAVFPLTAQTSYTITDLGALGTSSYSVGRGVNSTGEVTGSTGGTDTALSQVYIYSNGAMTGLGTLGGNSGIGNGINASGQAAGYSQNASGTYRAFLTSGDTLIDIGDLGGGSAVAYAINDSGDVVGSSVTADGSNHPFFYSGGTMTDLGTLGAPAGTDWWNSAQGVNNSGVVTGTSYNAEGNFLAFVWSNGTMTPMGTLGGLWSQGFAINNKGQVAGLAYLKSGAAHAFLANCATCKLKDLGTLEALGTTWGFGINDSGVVVGQATSGAGYHAFVYSGGKIKDLNKMIPAKSGWVLVEAYGINAAGQITGMGMHGNEEHAYLLTPQ